MPDLAHKPKCGGGLYASGLSLLKQSVCGVVGGVAGGHVLICEVLSVWCICVVCGVYMQSLAVSGVYMCWLICVVWGDGVCVLGAGGGMRQRCSIKKTFTASRLITLQMKYICTHTQILTSGNQRW